MEDRGQGQRQELLIVYRFYIYTSKYRFFSYRRRRPRLRDSEHRSAVISAVMYFWRLSI